MQAKILILLDRTTSLENKAKGFSLAKKINNSQTNDALVKLLDDAMPRGRISLDEGIEAPWMEALHILLIKFPESGIKYDSDFNYRYIDKELFKKWWVENKQRIIYREDGTHFLKDAALNATAAPSAKAIPSNSVIDPKSELTYPQITKPSKKISVTHPKLQGSEELEARHPLLSPTEIKASLPGSLPWLTLVLLIVAACLLGYFLKKRS